MIRYLRFVYEERVVPEYIIQRTTAAESCGQIEEMFATCKINSVAFQILVKIKDLLSFKVSI